MSGLQSKINIQIVWLNIKQSFQLLKVSIVFTQVLSLIFGFVPQDNLSSQTSSVPLFGLNSSLI